MTETKSKCLIKMPIIRFLVACNILGLALSLSWNILTFLIWFQNIFELNGFVSIIRNAFRVFPKSMNSPRISVCTERENQLICFVLDLSAGFMNKSKVPEHWWINDWVSHDQSPKADSKGPVEWTATGALLLERPKRLFHASLNRQG